MSNPLGNLFQRHAQALGFIPSGMQAATTEKNKPFEPWTELDDIKQRHNKAMQAIVLEHTKKLREMPELKSYLTCSWREVFYIVIQENNNHG